MCTLTINCIQNDLEEFFAMVNFTNPGVLGDAATFRRYFEVMFKHMVGTSNFLWSSLGRGANTCSFESLYRPRFSTGVNQVQVKRTESRGRSGLLSLAKKSTR